MRYNNSSVKARFIAAGLSALVMMTGLSSVPAEVSAAKEKAPALAQASVSVKVDQTKTIRIKNIKPKQIKSLTVKSADKEIATVKKKNGLSFAIKGVNAYESTKVTATVKLKNKISGKNEYRFKLKVRVNPDKNLASKEKEGRAPNYNGGADWLHLPIVDNKKVDTIYIYPSVYEGTGDAVSTLAPMDSKEHVRDAQAAYGSEATVFEYDTNVYAPLYRQTSSTIYKKKTASQLEKYQRHEQKEDIFDALDIYFKNYNNNKPFILAGTEQGAKMVQIVVSDYFKRHPDYKKRLVTTYKKIVTKETVSAAVKSYCSKNKIKTATDNNIEILYTNDVHCGVEDAIGYAGLKQARDEMTRAGEETLLVDNGDAIQGGPVGTLTKGEAIVNLMNDVGYNVATFGNHEFDYGLSQLKKLIGKAKTYKYISCNFFDQTSGKPGTLFTDPFTIREIGGKKIAFIGATTPRTVRASMPSIFKNDKGEFVYSFMEDDENKFYAQIQAQVDSAKKEGADYCVLMAHLGIDSDCAPFRSTDVIENTTGIDVVLDGHSHTVMKSETKKNKDGQDVLLTQTGTKLNYIGRLIITSDGKIKTGLISNYKIKNPEITEAIARESREFAPMLKEKIGTGDFDLIARDEDFNWTIRKSETNLANLVSDAYRDYFKADIAFANAGGIRGNIFAGDILYEDLMVTCPTENDMVVRKVSGQSILDMLELSVSRMPEEKGGLLHASGMTFDVDLSKNADIKLGDKGELLSIEGTERRVSNVKVGGVPIDPVKEYTVAAQNFILLEGGSGMNPAVLFKDNDYILSDKTDITILKNYIQKTLGGKIPDTYRNPAGQGRMNIVTSSVPKTEEEKEATAIAEKIYQAAAEAEPEVTAVLKKLEDEKAHLEGLEFRLKTVESLARKIMSDAHDMEVSLKESASQIMDSLRYTFIIDDADYVAYTPKILDTLKAAGNKVTKFKNYWSDDTRSYQGINCNLESASGVVFEVQFHTPISFDTKNEKTHKYYEIIRDENSTPEEKAEAQAKQDELFAQIPVPEGVRELTYEVSK